MGIKRKIKNYIYLKNHYPLSDKTITPDKNKKNILIVDSQIPTFDKDSGSNRITEIAAFLAKNYNVYLMNWLKPIPKVEEKKYIQNFSNYNVIVYTPFINKYGIMRGKKHFLNKISSNVDYIWCHRPEIYKYYLEFFREKMPQAKIIYDMVDIHFLRMERGQEIHFDKKRKKEIEYYKNIETELSKQADKIVVISEQEKEFMMNFIDESKLFTISNVHDLKVQPKEMPPFEKRAGIFFIGSFLHDPNVDAVRFLYNKILPIVWQSLPNLKVFIIGHEVPEDILKMQSELFEVKGFVENIIPYYENCFASISPLRYGAGVKGKIGQALEYTLPIVTTNIGAEGMFLKNKVTALISDNEDFKKFAENIIEICSNKTIWETLHNNSEKAIYPFSIEAQKDEMNRLLS
ncbi:glycosyltransferase [Chryseobacterium sp. SSA4.19]|uniref:glycosyltransferase n=1 Tax=Chryseobacterium sp. SSA4.19 TaxID=2919915 RepID=UPI001F4DDF52|nr:glycosyltransferase [Chryseobacterium sp. SSA4.19]MCJ8153624.1 glycosyltransferase [Chryseobacterium sp. SSA4.19]